MRRHIPNALTIARLIMTAGFVGVLSVEPIGTTRLSVAIGLFVIASITDFLDGFLARRWRVESAFGRVMDPVADKVLVMGALMLMAGPALAQPTGVRPWMVVVVLTRELLVTGLRGTMEARGVQFGAMMSGKLKTTAQTLLIPVMLLLTAIDRTGVNPWLAGVIVVVTVVSGLPYVAAAVRWSGASPPKHPKEIGRES